MPVTAVSTGWNQIRSHDQTAKRQGLTLERSFTISGWSVSGVCWQHIVQLSGAHSGILERGACQGPRKGRCVGILKLASSYNKQFFFGGGVGGSYSFVYCR